MNWNIFDQARFANYPAGGGGYWQEKPDAAIKFVHEEFPKRFSKAIGSINNWSPDDFMGGLIADGADVWLLRVHNGGQDGEGRPHRWCVYACKVKIPTGRALHLSNWLADPKWPAPAVIPLPAKIPSTDYQPPTVAAPESIAATATIDSSCPSLDDAQTELFTWFASPGRGNGTMMFSSFNGKFVSKQHLEITPVPEKVELIPKDSGADFVEVRTPKNSITKIAAIFILLGAVLGNGDRLYHEAKKFATQSFKKCDNENTNSPQKSWNDPHNWAYFTNVAEWAEFDCPKDLMQLFAKNWNAYGFAEPIFTMTTNELNKILPQFRHDNNLTNTIIVAGILKIRDVSQESLKTKEIEEAIKKEIEEAKRRTEEAEEAERKSNVAKEESMKKIEEAERKIEEAKEAERKANVAKEESMKKIEEVKRRIEEAEEAERKAREAKIKPISVSELNKLSPPKKEGETRKSMPKIIASKDLKWEPEFGYIWRDQNDFLLGVEWGYRLGQQPLYNETGTLRTSPTPGKLEASFDCDEQCTACRDPKNKDKATGKQPCRTEHNAKKDKCRICGYTSDKKPSCLGHKIEIIPCTFCKGVDLQKGGYRDCKTCLGSKHKKNCTCVNGKVWREIK